MKKICFVVADPLTAGFLIDHMRALAKSYDITLVANFGEDQMGLPFLADFRKKAVGIERNISLVADLRALIKLFVFFRREQFAAVHSVTPKAGLLAMLAARLAGVSNRFHTFTGQVWITRTGLFKRLLKLLDRVLFVCSSHALVDSPSQRRFLIEQGIVTEQKSSVLGLGSICGVNIARFRPDPAARARLRRELNLPEAAFVFLFAGRINRDKGIRELVHAFSNLDDARHDAHLILLGSAEDDILETLRPALDRLGDRVIRRDWTDEPEAFMASADVFCLPSYREGFGAVIIEAAACGVPAIGSRIYGITDAIQEDVTGLLHAPADADDLEAKMSRLLSDHGLTEQLGERAKHRAIAEFATERVVAEMVDFYLERV